MSLPCLSRASRIERRAYKWVMKMLDDPGHHAAALERWLAKDPEHRAVYKRVAVEVGYASDAASQMPSLRIQAAGSQRATQWRPSGRLYVAAGLAAGMVALLIYMFAWQSIPPAARPAPTNQAPAELVMIESGSKALTLADGSNITMLGATALKIAYGASERGIELLRGRARFEVQHDVARPFVVYVGGGKVTAVGTVFEISADPKVMVHLVSGRVRVSLPADALTADRPDVLLNAGQQVGFDRSVTAPQAATERAEPNFGQTQSFDDVPVSAVVEQVNRLSPQKVILLDDETAHRKIFADLDISDADAVARKLALIFGLSIDRSVAGQIRLIEKK